MSFEKCMEFIFEEEGGFVNHPEDAGGPTNMGITQGALAHHRRQPVTAEDVKALGKAEASYIYHQFYWNRVRGGELAPEIALVMFNNAVLMGINTSVKLLQSTLVNDFGVNLVVDGKMGPKTIEAAQAVDSELLAIGVIRASQLNFAAICANNPSQIVFLTGWLNRSFRLQDKVIEFSRA